MFKEGIYVSFIIVIADLLNFGKAIPWMLKAIIFCWMFEYLFCRSFKIAYGEATGIWLGLKAIDAYGTIFDDRIGAILKVNAKVY